MFDLDRPRLLGAIVVAKLFERRVKTIVVASIGAKTHLASIGSVTVLSPAGAPVGRLSGLELDKITQTRRAKTQPVTPVVFLVAYQVVLVPIVEFGGFTTKIRGRRHYIF